MLDPSALDALLFDLDGTLLDSDDQAVEELVHRMEKLGFRDPARAARRLVMRLETPGNAFVTLLDLLGLDALLVGLTGWLHRSRGLRTASDFRLIPGADEALQALSARYRLAVVTTRGRHDAEAFLDAFELGHLFEALVAREAT